MYIVSFKKVLIKLIKSNIDKNYIENYALQIFRKIQYIDCLLRGMIFPLAPGVKICQTLYFSSS